MPPALRRRPGRLAKQTKHLSGVSSGAFCLTPDEGPCTSPLCPVHGAPACSAASGGAAGDSKDPAQLDMWVERRAERFRLRDVLRDHSGIRRVRLCGCRAIKKGFGVDVVMAEDRAHYANIQSCGSIGLCPVCAPKIREGRAEEIREILSQHLRAGGGAYFGMMTFPHDFGDDFASVIDVCAKAFSTVLAGRAYTDDRQRFGIIGTIRALEVTYGKNGAHPHLHPLILTETPLASGDLAWLTSRLFARWSAAVESFGYRAPDPRFTTLHAIRSSKDVADYVAKVEGKDRSVALELARIDLKRGRSSASRGRGADRQRTMFEVLADFADYGDRADLAVWLLYERAIAGRQHITFSKGLRKRFGIGERTDEELAAPEVGGETVYTFGVGEWETVIKARKRAAVLRAVELRGRAGVIDILAQLYERRNRRAGVELYSWVAPDAPEFDSPE